VEIGGEKMDIGLVGTDLENTVDGGLEVVVGVVEDDEDEEEACIVKGWLKIHLAAGLPCDSTLIGCWKRATVVETAGMGGTVGSDILCNREAAEAGDSSLAPRLGRSSTVMSTSRITTHGPFLYISKSPSLSVEGTGSTISTSRSGHPRTTRRTTGGLITSGWLGELPTTPGPGDGLA